MFCLLPEAELDLFKILAPLELAFFLSRGDLRSFDFFHLYPAHWFILALQPTTQWGFKLFKIVLANPHKIFMRVVNVTLTCLIHISNRKISFLGAS